MKKIKKIKKIKHIRRRLMAGMFCISLLFADLGIVIPAWAQEAEPIAKENITVGTEDDDEIQNPSEGSDTIRERNAEKPNANDGTDGDGGEGGSGLEQDSDVVSETDQGQDSGDGDLTDGSQDRDEENNDGETQEPEVGDGDSEFPKEAEGDESADDAESDTADNADAEEASDLSEEVEDSEVEDVSSVSENELPEQGDVYILADSGDDIASGSYGDITWVIAADGKLTVEGTGDFTSTYSTSAQRAPWYSKRSYVKSAEIKVSGMTDASYMFYGCYNMTDVTFDGSYTSTVTNLSHMFDGCFNKNLNLDLSDLCTNAAVNMSCMFSGCSRITDLDIGHFDTKNVTDMSYMFSGCSTLESIDFGQNFNTGNVADMSGMFSGCKILKSVDVSRFNATNVTNMSNLFYECRNLGDLNLSGWDTAKVTDMSYMFVNCGFHHITLGGSFTTHNVTDMTCMFACNSDPNNASFLDNQDRWDLKGFDLGWLDLSSVKTMRGIFSNCNVKQMDFGRLNTGGTTTLAGLFENCDLTGMDFSALRTDTITDMSYMFYNCKGTIDLHTLNTDHVTNMSWMFATWNGRVGAGYHPGINRLTNLDLSGFNTENVTDMSSMFRDQRELTSLNVNGLNTANVTDMYGMFYECESLTNIDLSGLDTSQVIQMSDMFCYCISLKEVKLGNLGTGNLVMSVDEDEGSKFYPIRGMFQGCSSLDSINLSKFNFENLSEADSFGASMVFYGCNKLMTIYTPYNVTYNQPLPDGDWYMANGTKLENNYLPKNLPYSVLIQRGSVPTVSATRMEVSKKKTVYDCGETIGTDDLTVIYYGADGSVRKLAEGEYTTNAAALDTTKPGTLDLVVICNKDGNTLTEEITLTVTYILSADNTTVMFPAEADYNYTYDGQPKMPRPVIVSYIKKTSDGTETLVTLTEGTDYTIAYRNNVNAYKESEEDRAGDGSDPTDTSGDGTDTAAAESDSTAAPTVIVKGTGAYSGTVTKTFTIRKAAAPDAEEKSITASQCAQARPNRTADLTGCFAAYGKKVGYEIVSVDDPKNVFSKTPVTADIQNGILTYGTNAAQESDTASITVKVSFANYEDAELTVKIVMVSKKSVVISGITMPEDTTYSGTAVTYDGVAAVTAEDGTVVTGQVTLVYNYSGTMADGTAYPAQSGATGSGGQTIGTAPVNAGRYVLTVAVAEDDEDYTGSTEYPFTISPAAVTVTALDVVDVMGEGEETSKPVSAYQSEFKYDTEGLLDDDRLDQQPVYAVTDIEGQPVTQIDLTKEGLYKIVPSGADAGMNYAISYVSGTLTVMEERVGYTVRFDCMGHGSSFVKSGIKAGSLLELSEEELALKAEGYLFAGWYQDKSFAKGREWNFDTDTVQSDLTLYACWLTDMSADDGGLKLCVQEIPDLTYTGSALKPAVTVYDSDGKTLLKAGKDYTIKYVRNIDAIAIGQDGKPVLNGGTAKVTDLGKTNEKITDVIDHFSKECPYVVITGKGNYKETICRNFRILPADISAAGETSLTATTENTPLAAGFTLKYTEQFEAKANKTAKIISSFKYKKALKADKDYTVSVQDENGAEVALVQGKLPLNAGNYALTVTGKGNYTGVVRRNLYVADKQKLMKNVSITYAKTVKAVNKEELSKGIEQTSVIVKIGGKAIDPENYEIDYAGTNHAVGTATMNVKGKNGYVGSKSVTFKITGMLFSAKTIEVKAYDTNQPDEKDWKASVPYTGRAVTQNKVALTAKATGDNPNARNLVYGDDYTITYKNNVKKGTATMTFTANPKSGFSGSFKKTFQVSAQNLSADMFVDSNSVKKELIIVGTDERKNNTIVKWDEDAVHSGSGASLSFTLKNKDGIELKQGTDYTVSYKDHKTATKESAEAAVKAGSKQPVMTIKGKGNYAGSLTVRFQIIPASITSGQLKVAVAQVQKKSGMKLQDFKLKIMDDKTTLKAGTDYIVDDTGCTPEIIKAYADSLGTAETAPEPKLVLTGIGNYGAKTAEGEAAGGKKEISLADYIYATKLTAKNLKVEVTGDRTYTGQNVEPTVKVRYFKDNNAAKQGATGVELTEGKDYQVTYGSKNIVAGKKKGSITVTGAGVYGGSVTVKFDIEKKQIY